uniref:Zn(2)-C6 fungal-type domain-containing protein n=1 Tax=Bionectria ochroleuca TaxID=29856 RepID=A0A8H7N071_BIOOC
MEEQRTTRATKWGAACGHCAAGKTRCIRSDSESPGACDRCRKLGKQCSDRAPRPRKKRQAKTAKLPQSTGISNDLVEAFEALGQSSIETTPSFNQLGTSSPAKTGSQAQSKSSEGSLPTAPVLGLGFGPPQSCTCNTPADNDDHMPLESDEALLAIYRSQLSARFPFVIIPASSTLRQLQTERPFLFKVVRMVASVRNLTSIRGQSRSILQHISEAMLLRSERSIDLLQGILVFLGFYHYHCMTHAQFGNLVHLSASLVEDMNLNVSYSPQNSAGILPLMRGQGARSRTNEENRTLLGVWYMSSNAALVTKHLGPARYTKDLDHCLRELESIAEYESDQLAVQLVRFQNTTNKIFHFHCRDQQMDELPGAQKVSDTECLEVFQAELDNLWNASSPKLRSNCLISCHYRSAYLQLLEPLLTGAHLPGAVSQTFDSLSLSGLFKVNLFSHFTAALKAWFDTWLALPVCSYFHMPQPAAGPNTIRRPDSGVNRSRGSTAPKQALPAMSGIPECPELSSIEPPVSHSSVTMLTQPLDSLKAKVLEQADLRIDVFGLLDSMTVRFESASKEMEAAQGGTWNNNTWDVAADHIRIKKAKIEKWCEITAAVGNEGRVGQSNQVNGVVEAPGEIRDRDMAAEWRMDGFEWHVPGDGQENGQWEAELFDEIMMDADISAFLDVPRIWGTDALDDMGATGRLATANASY